MAAVIYKDFYDKLTQNKTLKVFKIVFYPKSGYVPIDQMTDYMFEQIIDKSTVFPTQNDDSGDECKVETHIKDDVIIVRINYSNLNDHDYGILIYQDEDSDTLKRAIGFKLKEDGKDPLVENNDNYVYFDFRAMDLNCKFISIMNPQYSAIHNHISSAINANDNNQIVDIYDLNKKINDQLDTTIESENPTSIPVDASKSTKESILPNGRILGVGEDYLNVESTDFIENRNNLNVIQDNFLTKEDAGL